MLGTLYNSGDHTTNVLKDFLLHISSLITRPSQHPLYHHLHTVYCKVIIAVQHGHITTYGRQCATHSYCKCSPKSEIFFLKNIFSAIKTARYHVCYLSLLGDGEGRLLHELQKVSRCVKEGRSDRTVGRGKRVDLPENNKQRFYIPL